jgi:hypothetical protein
MSQCYQKLSLLNIHNDDFQNADNNVLSPTNHPVAENQPIAAG